ncbi:MAG: hypothetical protein HC916_20390 [Coleofasciculaceae cyanobacterium SM2_1_6]|nr:hypothetical protein [Coleofasciculaceae cyanobacterium SM2_1_6]
MDKFLVIRLEGKADHFFSVNYEILDSDLKVIHYDKAYLPSCLNLVNALKRWRTAYRADLSRKFGEPKNISISNSSEIDHVKLVHDLKISLNDWLSSPEFQPCKEKLLAKLDPREVVLVGIGTDDHDLKYVPWHLWSFFEHFPKSDFALLRPSFSKVNDKLGNTENVTRPSVNIMAIIGDSRGIDTAEDTTVIKSLSRVNYLQILSEPSKDEVRNAMWSAGLVDILFLQGTARKSKIEARSV